MTIPKKRNYGRFVVMAGLGLVLSVAAIPVAASITQALTLPGLLRDDTSGSRQNSNQGTNTNTTANQRQTQDQRQQQTNTTNTSSGSQSSSSVTRNTPATQQPVQSQPVAPQPAQAIEAQTVTNQTTAQPATRQQSTEVAPVANDTSAVSRQLASAQTSKTLVPSVYSSAKITTDSRNSLYRASLIAALVGVTVYLLSYAGATVRMVNRISVSGRKPITQ